MSNFTLIEGFDYYNSAGTGAGGVLTTWDYAGSGEYDIETGRFGYGKALRLGDITGGSRALTRRLSEPMTAFSIGCAMKKDTTGSGSEFFALQGTSTGTTHIELRTSSNEQALLVYAGGVLIATLEGIFVTGSTWIYLEMVGSIHPTEGRLEIWIDNTKHVDFTGKTDAGLTVTHIEYIKLRCADGRGSNNWFWFDDLYVNKVATRLGEMQIDYLPVSADTVDKDFIPSTGVTNYDLLNTIPVSTTNYVTGNALGDLDVYELTDLAADDHTITTVQPIILGVKTAAGERVVEIQGRSATAKDVASISLGYSPRYYLGAMMDVDPNTLAPWTFAGFNSMQLGFEVTT